MNDAAFDHETLDPGIRDLVVALREAGFHTTDSGDGVSKGMLGMSFAHVAFTVRTGPDAVVGGVKGASLAADLTGRPWDAHLSTVVHSDGRPEDAWVVMLVDCAQYAAWAVQDE